MQLVDKFKLVRDLLHNSSHLFKAEGCFWGVGLAKYQLANLLDLALTASAENVELED